jgi:osmotically-inducible protein OsmY
MGSSTSGGLSMMNAANLSGGFGVLGFASQNGFGSSTSGGTMYGGRAYGAVTQAGGSSTTGTSGGNRTTGTSGSSSGGGGGSTTASSSRRRGGSTTSSTASKDQQAWFEPRIEVGFEVSAPRALTAVAANVATSLGATKPGSRFRGVQVAVEGGTAILRGVVGSQNDRIVAEQIALLEPAISSVRNDLTIASRGPVSSNVR